ncbi:MAG: ABC transporter ATP-binding protein, partial [Thalassovita sp.]
AGGWSDYRAQRQTTPDDKPAKEKTGKKKAETKLEKASEGLSFTEKHRLEALPGVIERLEAEIAKLEDFLMNPELFTKEPLKFKKASEALAERQQALAAAEEEWLELEEKAG